MSKKLQQRARRDYRRFVAEDIRDVDEVPVVSCVDQAETSSVHDIGQVSDIEYESDLLDAENSFDEVMSDVFHDCSASEDELIPDTPADSVPNTPKISLVEGLFLFYVYFCVSRQAMNFLLSLLFSCGMDVPRSLYLLKARFKASFPMGNLDINKTDGLAYFSIVENLKRLVDSKHLVKSEELCVHVNIDGVLLFKSSRVNLWPILVKIPSITSVKNIFMVSLFCGIGKPDLTKFITPFVDEVARLQKDGFVYKSLKFVISKILFICDIPAKSFVQCTKGHSGYDSCQYCRQHGKIVMNRMTFPLVKCEDRTNEAYANMQENNQLVRSPLLRICSFVSDFPLDPMHAVYLGVVRKLIRFFCLPTKGIALGCRLSKALLAVVDGRVERYRACVPVEFQRKPRKLVDLEHFKATEFRTYLLYYGPFVFKDVLPKKYYDHLMLLHFSMYVYSSSLFTSLVECANSCLHNFVVQMGTLYGQQSLISNVHQLSHLPEFVRSFGPLDSFSAFHFESFLGQVKKRVKSTNGIFVSAINQILAFPSPVDSCVIYSASSPNNYCLIDQDGHVGKIDKCVRSGSDGSYIISGFHLTFVRSLYESPYPSSLLLIGYYQLSRRRFVDITAFQKCIGYETKSHEVVIFPYCF